MWDQVLTLAVLPFAIKGLALEVEWKSSAYSLCCLILYGIVIWSFTFRFLPSRVKPRWAETVDVNVLQNSPYGRAQPLSAGMRVPVPDKSWPAVSCTELRH